MFDRLVGSVVDKQKGYLIIQTASGWGYKVFVPSRYNDLAEIQHNSSILLFVVVLKKEFDESVYGFILQQERDTFLILCSVHGVGPKTALQILSALSVCGLHRAVVADDASVIKKVYGVGEKTAKRILFELRPKFIGSPSCISMNNIEVNAHTFTDISKAIFRDAYDIMVRLGYSNKAAEIAIQRVMDINMNDPNIEIIVELALKEATNAIIKR